MQTRPASPKKLLLVNFVLTFFESDCLRSRGRLQHKGVDTTRKTLYNNFSQQADAMLTFESKARETCKSLIKDKVSNRSHQMMK